MLKHVIPLTGFLAACVGLYAWYTAPTAGLEASVYSAEFELPASIAQQVRALKPLTVPGEFRGIFLEPSFRQRMLPTNFGLPDQIISGVTAFANEKAPIIQHESDFAFKGYWKVIVRNTGSRSASSVTLHFPMTVSGVISRPHSESKPVQELQASTTKVFSLGNILPGDDEEIIVYAWSPSPPTEDAAKKITLTHDVGVGRVRLLH